MSKENIINKLNSILNIDEFTPVILDKGWKKHMYHDIKKTEYKITKQLLGFIKSCYTKIKDMQKDKSNKIIKYYLVTDGNNSFIGITNQTVIKAVVKQLVKLYLGEESILNNFVDLTKVIFKLVLCTKKEEDDIMKTKKYLEKKYKTTKSYAIPYKDTYKMIIEDLGGIKDKNKYKSNVFLLVNKDLNKYFIGSSNSENKDKIIKSLTASYKDIKQDMKKLKHSFKFKFLEEISFSTEIEHLIILDLLSEKYGINNCYNGYRYCKKKLDKQKIFLDVNKELSIKNIADTYNYEGSQGFIYLIRNIINNAKYINVAKDDLKSVVERVYNNKESKQDNLFNDLKQFPYSDFEFSIIKFKKDKNTDLNIELGRLLERYGTKNSYNII